MFLAQNVGRGKAIPNSRRDCAYIIMYDFLERSRQLDEMEQQNDSNDKDIKREIEEAKYDIYIAILKLFGTGYFDLIKSRFEQNLKDVLIREALNVRRQLEIEGEDGVIRFDDQASFVSVELIRTFVEIWQEHIDKLKKICAKAKSENAKISDTETSKKFISDLKLTIAAWVEDLDQKFADCPEFKDFGLADKLGLKNLLASSFEEESTD